MKMGGSTPRRMQSGDKGRRDHEDGRPGRSERARTSKIVNSARFGKTPSSPPVGRRRSPSQRRYPGRAAATEEAGASGGRRIPPPAAHYLDHPSAPSAFAPSAHCEQTQLQPPPSVCVALVCLSRVAPDRASLLRLLHHARVASQPPLPTWPDRLHRNRSATLTRQRDAAPRFV